MRTPHVGKGPQFGFLYRVNRHDLTRPRPVFMAYDDHPEFNDWIDEQSEPVHILSLPPYRPSDVLFNVDLEAYRDLLADYEAEQEVDSAAAKSGDAN